MAHALPHRQMRNNSCQSSRSNYLYEALIVDLTLIDTNTNTYENFGFKIELNNPNMNTDENLS